MWGDLALIFEAIAIPVVDGNLSKTHHATYLAPVTAIIVGIHFFGLVPAFKTRLYLVIGGAMCALAGLTMFLLPATETVGGGGIASPVSHLDGHRQPGVCRYSLAQRHL